MTYSISKWKKIFNYRILLFILSICLIIIPCALFEQTYTIAFEQKLGRYSIYFLILYFLARFILRKKINSFFKPKDVILICFIIFEISCISLYTYTQWHLKTFLHAYQQAYEIVYQKNNEQNKSISAEEELLNEKISKSFSSESILTIKGLADAKLTIQAYKKLLEKKRKLISQYYDDFDKTFSLLGIKNKDFLDNFHIGQGKGILMYNSLFDIQMSESSIFSELLTILEKNQGHVSFQNDQLIFDDNETKQKYLNLLEKLDALSKQEELSLKKIKEGRQKLFLIWQK